MGNRVILEAVPNVKVLALEMVVSERRVYQKLNQDDPYGKAKEIVRDIANAFGDAQSIENIKADFSAHCDRLIQRIGCRKVSNAEVHKELSEAIQAVLDDVPPADQEREIREAIGTLNQKLVELGSREVVGGLRRVK